MVSLSPALTETLFALGVGERLVGVSDFCHEPASVEGLPRTGSVFAPRFEAIVALGPSLVLAEKYEGARFDDLTKLVDVMALPWLTYEQVLSSTLDLGKRVGRVSAAEALVERYRAALSPMPAPDAPRVLLALSQVPGQLSEVYYVRRNSLHGRVLEAAGGWNAVKTEAMGPPRLSLEQVILLDPDLVIVLEPSERRDDALLEDWRKLSGLRAVRSGQLGWVGAKEAEVPGPRIVKLVERLRVEILRLRGAIAVRHSGSATAVTNTHAPEAK